MTVVVQIVKASVSRFQDGCCLNPRTVMSLRIPSKQGDFSLSDWMRTIPSSGYTRTVAYRQLPMVVRIA